MYYYDNLDYCKKNMFFTGDEPKEVIQKFMKNNGFIVLKNAFNPQQISDFNSFFLLPENKKKFLDFPPATKMLPGASHIIDGFEKVIAAPKILKVLDKLIPGKIAYTSHSDLQSGVVSPWHKDDGGGKYFQGLSDYFINDDCCVYKIGIYLRDCSDEGGLTVKVGSHRMANYSDGDELYITSGLGDAIFFDVRITHKGWHPKYYYNIFHQALRKVLKKMKILKGEGKVPFEKNSIFFSVGALNEFTEIFSRKNMERQNKQHGRDIPVMQVNLKRSLKDKDIHCYFD